MSDTRDLVERRQQYIRRQIDLNPDAVDVRLTPDGTGGRNRHGMPRLPVGWKGTTWIRKIECLADDRKGFWEVRGYSNTAEPWFNDRYATR